MANLTITVPDAAVPRIRAAFGSNMGNSVQTPATVAEIQEAIKTFVRQRVLAYEGDISRTTAEKNLTDELKTW